MNDISSLYGQIISEHRKFPRNKGLIQGYKTLRLKNPSCGDDVTVQVDIKDLDILSYFLHLQMKN